MGLEKQQIFIIKILIYNLKTLLTFRDMNKKYKKTIKINFRYFPENFDPENNFLTNLLRSVYNVIIDKDAKHVFFSIYGDGPKNIGGIGSKIRRVSPDLYGFLRRSYAKIFPIKIPEPEKEDSNKIRIFFSLEYVKPDMNKYDWGFSYIYEDQIKNPRYMRLPEYLWYGAGTDLIKDKNYAKRMLKQKTKFCNFIYFNEVKFRNDFFKKLSRYKKVDSPGYCMNNMPYVEGKDWKNETYGEWHKAKVRFMKPYKFSVVSEYRIIPGLTDEKIYHAMLAGCIPIYLGNPLVHKDFNTKSFINVHNFKNFDEAIKKVIEIDNDNKLYEEMLNQPWLINNKPGKYMDKKRILKRFERIFG